MLTRGLSVSRGGGEACCKTRRRRRGALENISTGCSRTVTGILAQDLDLNLIFVNMRKCFTVTINF